MSSASALRLQIEAALSDRIPSALTPAARLLREVMPTGVAAVDELLHGGLPVGVLTEMTGAACCGRTSLALSFVAGVTRAERVCAWVDGSDALSPESAAAAGVDLRRLLWVRCGVQAVGTAGGVVPEGFAVPRKYLVPAPPIKGLHGGGFGPHPRSEVKGMSEGVGSLLRAGAAASQPLQILGLAGAQEKTRDARERFESVGNRTAAVRRGLSITAGSQWTRIEQALRVTDLLLQAGGFSAIVLDMAGIAPEHVSRVPLATWFRYRAAAERTHACVLLLTQYACAKSSAGLALRLGAGGALSTGRTLFVGREHSVEVSRQRFAEGAAPEHGSNVVPLRKPPQRVSSASWQSRTAWAGR